ncbi:MAG: thioesterase family protein [Pirellulales bacterium]
MDRKSLDATLVELLAPFPVIVTTLVAWGEMDANHHVNNVVYFRYMEHARLKYFGEMGFSKEQRASGIGPILAWTDCRFRRPLEYPDTVSIGTRISELKDDRFMMDTVIVSHKLKEIAAHGQQKLVIYDYHNNVKASLPPHVRQRIAEIEATAGHHVG